MAALEPVYYNVPKWIENNEQYFLPPVCNKMMHNTQLKVKKIYIFFKKLLFEPYFYRFSMLEALINEKIIIWKKAKNYFS